MSTESPHVLHLHSSAGVYGAEHVLLGLIPALARAGVRSTLLSLDNPLRSDQPLFDRARALDVPAERVPCSGRWDWATVRALRAKLSATPNALLHVHGYKSAFYGWLASRARVPVVATLHGSVYTSARLWLYTRIEQHLLRRFDRICVVSAPMRPQLTAAGIPEGNIRLVENGIDTERFRPEMPPISRNDLDIPAEAFVFGGVMRLSEEKNPLGLVQAFAGIVKRGSAAWLVIAGDGPLHAEVSALAERLGVAEQVRLLAAREDLESFYPMLDCFVLPSHSEGLPLALLEAMATARSIVATDVGQVSSVLAGLPARLVPPGDPEALASAMQAAMDDDRRAYPELRRRVCERYSVAKMAQAYAEVYEELWRSHGYAFA